jgi:hypothetical protein
VPSIFQDMTSSQLPSRFLTYDGSSSLACFTFLPSLLSVTVILGDLVPYSYQVSLQ